MEYKAHNYAAVVAISILRCQLTRVTLEGFRTKKSIEAIRLLGKHTYLQEKPRPDESGRGFFAQ